MNVFRANNDSSETIDNIKSELNALGSKTNEDMSIDLAGRCHNNEGFILRVVNMERITDALLTDWRGVLKRKGFSPDIQYDFQDGTVDIRCTRVQVKSPWKAHHVQLLGYISLALLSIYMLWSRRNLPHPK